MNLNYKLPENQYKLIMDETGGEKIKYCIPIDLDDHGKYLQAWLVVTSSYIIKLENSCILDKYGVKDASSYLIERNVGCRMLVGIIKGKKSILSRFTMSNSLRYAYISRALNEIIKGSGVNIISEEEENRCGKCGMQLPEGMHFCRRCVNSRDLFKRMWPYAGDNIWLFTLLFLMFLFVTASAILSPYIQKILIDNYLLPGIADLRGILLLTGALLAVHVFNMTLTIIRGRITSKLGNNITAKLRQQVYEKLQSLSLSYVNTKKSGHIMTIMTRDSNEISNFIVNYCAEGVNQIFTLVVIIFILFTSSWKLAILVLLPAPLVFYGARIRWDTFKNPLRKSKILLDNVTNYLQDILSGIRVVKSFGQEERAVRRFSEESRKYADISVKMEQMMSTSSNILYFITCTGSFLVMFFGGLMVLENQMHLGELVQYIQYTAMVYGPFRFLTFFPRQIGNVSVGLDRMFNIMDMEPEINHTDEDIDIDIKGKITFKNVTFGYKSHEPVLENIDVEINPGEMIGLVGHSGAGKSTFINLLMRLYDVDDGIVSIDGTDIKNISHKSLRGQLGIVLQETFLFSGTILENIRYSKPDATPIDVIKAAKIANAHEFIMKFPDAYDTLVGEKGQRLSGGERQRIAIARAILNDPRILILDEATSALDTETEQKVQEALERLTRNRTTIAIAHRLSTLKNANRLMVIENGKNAEIGSHEELMKLEGIYHSMVTAQRKIQ